VLKYRTAQRGLNQEYRIIFVILFTMSKITMGVHNNIIEIIA
jgi:hypothetical protein